MRNRRNLARDSKFTRADLKPRIRWDGGDWVCSGLGYEKRSFDQQVAYMFWWHATRMVRNKIEARAMGEKDDQ